MRKRQAKKIYKTNLEGYRQQSVTKALQKCPPDKEEHEVIADIMRFVDRIKSGAFYADDDDEAKT